MISSLKHLRYELVALPQTHTHSRPKLEAVSAVATAV